MKGTSTLFFMSRIKLNGHDVLIMTGETATLTEVAAQRDCTVNIDSEMIEKASATDGTVMEYLAGRYGWTMQVNGLYALGDHAGLVDYLQDGTLLHVGCYIGNEPVTGRAYVETMEVAGAVKGKATYNVTLRGSGELNL